jgi:hypothetical protein
MAEHPAVNRVVGGSIPLALANFASLANWPLVVRLAANLFLNVRTSKSSPKTPKSASRLSSRAERAFRGTIMLTISVLPRIADRGVSSLLANMSEMSI